MAKSKLTQLLDYFEGTPDARSISTIARELDLSLGQVENMVDYWVHKGRLLVAGPDSECGSCSSNKSCPFVVEFPRIIEVVQEKDPHYPKTTCTVNG